MCPSRDLGTLTINGKFRIRGYFITGFKFLLMGIKEIFNNASKFEKDTSDLMYSITANLDIKQR